MSVHPQNSLPSIFSVRLLDVGSCWCRIRFRFAVFWVMAFAEKGCTCEWGPILLITGIKPRPTPDMIQEIPSNRSKFNSHYQQQACGPFCYCDGEGDINHKNMYVVHPSTIMSCNCAWFHIPLLCLKPRKDFDSGSDLYEVKWRLVFNKTHLS